MVSSSARKPQIEFVDELPEVVGKTWQERLAPLVERPGTWARIETGLKHPQAVATAINKGRIKLDGIYRATFRQGQLYVCYCGDSK
jgi:hypothetical protein